MLHFRLRVFRAAALNLSFTQAAEELYITQPAVTKNIKELEKTLGISLFERNKSGLSLTKAGQLLLNYAEFMTEQESKLLYELGMLKQSFSGDLRLGTSTTIGQYLLPPVLAEFNKQHPDIRIFLQNKNTVEIEKGVLNKEMDLGIVEGSSKKKELKYIPFMRDEIVAVVRISHPLAARDSIRMEELKTIPLVLREIGSGTLEVIVEKLAKHGIKLKDLNIVMHLGGSEIIKNFLEHSDCVGLISIYAAGKELANNEFKIIDIEGLELTRYFNFIYPHGQQNGLVEKFMNFVTGYYKHSF
jgi:Transcriptional regulator